MCTSESDCRNLNGSDDSQHRTALLACRMVMQDMHSAPWVRHHWHSQSRSSRLNGLQISCFEIAQLTLVGAHLMRLAVCGCNSSRRPSSSVRSSCKGRRAFRSSCTTLRRRLSWTGSAAAIQACHPSCTSCCCCCSCCCQWPPVPTWHHVIWGS